MKKYSLILFILFAFFACKQTEWAPEGPTDVRVKNMQTDITFYDVVIKTAGGRDTTGNIKKLGTITPGDTSEYQRVTFAYPKAEITATVSGQTYSTGTFESTYMQYLSRHRVTYEVYISNPANKELKIDDVIYDEPLVLK